MHTCTDANSRKARKAQPTEHRKKYHSTCARTSCTRRARERRRKFKQKRSSSELKYAEILGITNGACTQHSGHNEIHVRHASHSVVRRRRSRGATETPHGLAAHEEERNDEVHWRCWTHKSHASTHQQAKRAAQTRSTITGTNPTFNEASRKWHARPGTLNTC